MNNDSNIFLIGPRACGKTSVGRGLADALGLEFVDTDHELVASVGMEIAEYVEANGWDGFRDKESETLHNVAGAGVRVIGCGGGIVLREANRDVLSTGVTIYLKAEPDVLAERLMQDPNEAQRPSLTGKSIVDEVREILEERAPLYEGCADIIVSEPSLAATIERVQQELAKLS